MVRTYKYGVYIHFEKNISDANRMEKTEEIGWLPIDGDSVFRDISEEQVSLRKDVNDYDHFGCGWKDEDTGEVWLYGTMTEKKMKEMDKEFNLLKEGTVL